MRELNTIFRPRTIGESVLLAWIRTVRGALRLGADIDTLLILHLVGFAGFFFGVQTIASLDESLLDIPSFDWTRPFETIFGILLDFDFLIGDRVLFVTYIEMKKKYINS